MPQKFLAPLSLAAGLGLAVLSPAQAADFTTITQSVEVNRSADDVWKRVGDYCAISEWMKVSCDYASGSGEAGTVRRLMNGATIEPMVAKTAHSYTYWQSQGNMAAAAFHGTLAVEPQTRSTSRLSYTLVYDQAALASDAVRQSEHDRLSKRFQGLVETMKALAEAK